MCSNVELSELKSYENEVSWNDLCETTLDE